MENERKSNGTLVGILIGLIIALIIGGCLFVTGTIGFKTDATTGNGQSSENNQTETNDNSTSNNTVQETTKYFYDVKDLKIVALPEHSLFADISNNTNVVEKIDFGFEKDYAAILDLSGDVTVQKYSKSANDNGITNKLNVTGIIDVVQFNIPAIEAEQLLYMLTDNGDVYYYRIGDIEKNNFNATKVESVSNVKKIFISNNYSRPNAGGAWALFAITGDNDCIMIKVESV